MFHNLECIQAPAPVQACHVQLKQVGAHTYPAWETCLHMQLSITLWAIDKFEAIEFQLDQSIDLLCLTAPIHNLIPCRCLLCVTT